MEQWKFGDILRQTRERKGLSFADTANRLRIRPDILRAIEESNISAMPPRGYARNMVTGYARYLGLDPQEIGSMYLEELQVYEDRRARVRARQNGEPVDSGAYRNDRMTTRTVPRPTSESSSSASRTGSTGRVSSRPRSGGDADSTRTARMQRVDRNSDRDYDYEDTGRSSRRSSVRSSQENQRSNPLQAAAGALSNAAESISGSRKRPSFNSSGRGRQTRDPMLKANDYVSFLQGSGNSESKLPFILAAIIILLVLIIILAFALGGHGNKKEEEVTTLPVNTVQETVQEQAEAAPTKFTFAYQIDEGTESWVEIYVDDELQVGEILTGPTSGSYDITGTVQFVSAASDGVHVTIDGQEQELEFDGNGSVNMTFTFADFLSDWQKEHGVAGSTAATSSSDSSTTSSESTDATSTETESTEADTTAEAATEEVATDETVYYDDTTYYDDGTGVYY